VSSSPGQYTQVTLRLPVHEAVAAVSSTAK